MSNKYDLQTLLQAVLFNTCEVLPTDHQQLEGELKTLVERANSSGETIMKLEIMDKLYQQQEALAESIML